MIYCYTNIQYTFIGLKTETSTVNLPMKKSDWAKNTHMAIPIFRFIFAIMYWNINF